MARFSIVIADNGGFRWGTKAYSSVRGSAETWGERESRTTRYRSGEYRGLFVYTSAASLRIHLLDSL